MFVFWNDSNDDDTHIHYTLQQYHIVITTVHPSAKPTRIPTASPTPRPTRQPTAKPTRYPTGQPSSSPSGKNYYY